MNYYSILHNAMTAARDKVNEFKEKGLRETAKGKVGDFVTDADTESEKILVEHLKEGLLDCSILTEETQTAITESNFRKIPLLAVIDPVDATTNLRFDIPPSAISIGIWRYDKPVCGAILNLANNDFYWVESGKGLWLNGAPIKRRQPPPLLRAVVGASWSYGDTPRESLQLWKRLVGRIGSLRVMGCAAMDLVMVATGQFTCFIHNDMKPYDLGAGLIMAREAGLKATDWSGQEATIFTKNVLVAPLKLYSQFSNLLFGN